VLQACPQIFERALEELGASREDVLHIGDSLSGDVAGAIRARIPVAKALPVAYRMHGAYRVVATGMCLVVMGFGLYIVPATLG
jgi:predicted HAD superfamily phosphohydrolase YqeG